MCDYVQMAYVRCVFFRLCRFTFCLCMVYRSVNRFDGIRYSRTFERV